MTSTHTTRRQVPSLLDSSLAIHLENEVVKVRKMLLRHNTCHTQSIFDIQLSNGLILYGRRLCEPKVRFCRFCVSLVPQTRYDSSLSHPYSDHPCQNFDLETIEPRDIAHVRNPSRLDELSLHALSLIRTVQVQRISIPFNGTLLESTFTLYIQYGKTLSLKGGFLSLKGMNFCQYCHLVSNDRISGNERTKCFQRMMSLHFVGWGFCNLCVERFYWAMGENYIDDYWTQRILTLRN